MSIIKAIIRSVGPIEHYTAKDGKGSTKLDVIMEIPGKGKDNTLKVFSVFRHKTYSFDLIKNFEADKFGVGDTIDFDYNLGNDKYLPVIWRIYNHKRTRN